MIGRGRPWFLRLRAWITSKKKFIGAVNGTAQLLKTRANYGSPFLEFYRYPQIYPR